MGHQRNSQLTIYDLKNPQRVLMSVLSTDLIQDKSLDKHCTREQLTTDHKVLSPMTGLRQNKHCIACCHCSTWLISTSKITSLLFFLNCLSTLSTVGYSSETMSLWWSLWTLCTRTPGDSYRRWFVSLLLCHLFYVWRQSRPIKCLTLAIFGPNLITYRSMRDPIT